MAQQWWISAQGFGQQAAQSGLTHAWIGRRGRSLISGLLLVMVLSVLTACGSKINKANFEKIETGMAETAVTELLGKPAETNSAGFGPFSGTNSKWSSNEGTITIQFVNGQVVSKQFTAGK